LLAACEKTNLRQTRAKENILQQINDEKYFCGADVNIENLSSFVEISNELEQKTGKKGVSPLNAKNVLSIESGSDTER
jgi:hypothetical protein